MPGVSMQQDQGSPHPSEGVKRVALPQKLIADDAVNGYLFQLGKIGVWNAKVDGLWANQPTQANDLTDVGWVD